MPSRTPFQTLGVSPQSTADEIKHAYRALVLKWHPDRYEKDKAMATKRFIEINEAYKQLTEALELESNFEEPIVMNNDAESRTSSIDRQSSRSSSEYSGRRPPPASRSLPPIPISPNHHSQQHTQLLIVRIHTRPPRLQRRHDMKLGGPVLTFQMGSDLISILMLLDYRILDPVPPAFLSRRHSLQRPIRSARGTFTPLIVLYLQAPWFQGLGQSGEWTYALPLSLEELFTGIHLTLPITRRLLSGRSKTVTLELDIPAGCRKGSKLVCKRVGHEVKHGVFQDIAFIIEDKVHSRFRRECDDLHVEMRVPLVENLRDFGGEVPLVGVDGQLLVFFIDFPRHGAMEGRSIIKGGGMPSRHGGKVVGKGNMIVDWEIVPPQPKKVMGFVKRFWRK
ncbi:hypothetical protein H1R20_g12602, partial [Candolleomyces eurysporus]